MSAFYAYGLTIHSELPLPELASSTLDPDVHIRIDEQLEFPSNFADDMYTYVTPRWTFVYLENVALVEVRDGKQITIRSFPEVEPITLRNYVIGPVLNQLLFQRQLLVVHASVVMLNGRAVAFVGQSGWGKSTLAAHMQQRGHLLVSDDALVIDLSTSTSSARTASLSAAETVA